MMIQIKWLRPAVSALLLLVTMTSLVFSKSEEWTDPNGEKFKGDPSAILGPLAVFRTGLTTMKRFPLRLLSDEDCVRFASKLSARPQRAQDWSQAKSSVSDDIIRGEVLRIENGKLVPAKLNGIIEPEFYIVFYASSGVGESWGMMGSAIWKFQEMQKQFPGMVEGLFFGMNHSLLDHNNMALSLKLPWLVADFREQGKMDLIRRIGPAQAPFILVMTREGVPMFGTTETDEKNVGAILDQLTELIKLMNPENPLSWSDRVHYERALQLSNHRTGEVAPILVGNPLNVGMLEKYKVKKFSATLQVAADGTVKSAVMAAGFDMPQKIAPSITNALKKAVFVPALKDGQFVEGTFEYKFEASP